MKAHHDSQVVPTNALADVIEPKVALLEKRLVDERSSGLASPFAALYHEVVEACGTMSEDAVSRRLYAIRNRQCITTGLGLAEAFLNALDLDINLEPIPHFPATRQEALEMAEVWCEDWSIQEQRKFASDLFRFSGAYLRASADDETLEIVRKTTERRRPRLQALREERRAARDAGREQVAA